MPGSARVAIAVLSVAIVAACEPPIEPIPPVASQILVHAVLDLGADTQTVLLERSLRDAQQQIAIRGATVTVTTPEGHVITAAENPPDSLRLFAAAVYRFQMSQQPVALKPGGTYALRIVTPGGDTITGATTVPNAAPARDTVTMGTLRRLSDTLRLSWPRVPGAKGYHVTVNAPRTVGSFGFKAVYHVFADTAIALPGNKQSLDDNPVFPPGATATVVVAAVEDNYHTYYRLAVDPFAGAPASRLTGALGVFGAIVPVVIRRFDVQ